MARPSTAQARLRDRLERAAAPTRALAAEAGWEFGSVEDLLLRRGAWYRAGPRGPGPAPPDTTFAGAAVRAARLHLRYVEGYVLTRDDRVLPAAWAGTGDHLVHQPHPDHLAWLGIALSDRFRRRATRRTGAACVLHAQPLDHYRLLRLGLPADATPDTPPTR